MAYANIYNCESKYEVYLNSQLQSDVVGADDALGEIVLFEHDRQGQRVPWYDEQTCFDGWATIKCRGKVTLKLKEQASTNDNLELLAKNQLDGRDQHVYLVRREIYLSMFDSGVQVPNFSIPQLNAIYGDCWWFIDGLLTVGDTTLEISFSQSGCLSTAPSKILVHVPHPNLKLRLNKFSDLRTDLNDNWMQRKVDFQIYPNAEEPFLRWVIDQLEPYKFV